KELKCLPDPKIGNDNHYQSFEDLYGILTTEDECPSLLKRKPTNISIPNVPKKNGMGFSPTFQRAKNVGQLVRCFECNKPRVLYALRKLKDDESKLLSQFIES